MITSKNLLKKLKLKVNKAFVEAENSYPDVEIIGFDYSILEKAVSLVEAVYYILRIVYPAEYNFWLVFVFSLRKDFIVCEIKFYIKGGKFGQNSVIVYKTSRPQLKPSKKHSLFVVLNGYNLPSEKSPIILESLKKVGSGFTLKVGIEDLPLWIHENFYSFELPIEVKVLEYLV
jgi:hypothetical protein